MLSTDIIDICGLEEPKNSNKFEINNRKTNYRTA